MTWHPEDSEIAALRAELEWTRSELAALKEPVQSKQIANIVFHNLYWDGRQTKVRTRETVLWLHSLGLETIDPVDDWMYRYECDRSYPCIVIKVDVRDLSDAAPSLMHAMLNLGVQVVSIRPKLAPGEVSIQATFDPTDEVGLIFLKGLDDRALAAARRTGP